MIHPTPSSHGSQPSAVLASSFLRSNMVGAFRAVAVRAAIGLWGSGVRRGRRSSATRAPGVSR